MDKEPEPELIVAGMQHDGPTVIDHDEFLASLVDPEWRKFCKEADEYVRQCKLV